MISTRRILTSNTNPYVIKRLVIFALLSTCSGINRTSPHIKIKIKPIDQNKGSVEIHGIAPSYTSPTTRFYDDFLTVYSVINP